MQQISFNILGITIWKNTSFIKNYAICNLLLSQLFVVFVGVCTYHLIEKPVALLGKRMITE